MRRAFHIALAAAAFAGTEARAQFRETPMVLYAPARSMDVLPYASNAMAPSDFGLLTLYRDPSSLAVQYLPDRAHHDMLALLPALAAQPSPRYDCVASGLLAENYSDALTDVAYCVGSSVLQIAFGDDHWNMHTYSITLNYLTEGGPSISFTHLLPRNADVVVVPRSMGNGIDPGHMNLWDFNSSDVTSLASVLALAQQRRSPPQREEVWAMRIGAAAVAQHIDDLYFPGSASLQVFENQTPAGATTVGEISLGTPQGSPPTQQYLPVLIRPQSGIPLADCEGAATLDVNFDHVLDLVVSLAVPSPPYAPGGGHVYSIQGRGPGPHADVLQLASEPWTDMNSVLGLVDPFLVRPLEIGGEPAVAIWDRGLDEILVIRTDYANHRLAVWRGTTAGRHVRGIQLADVVGSPMPDLVVDGTGVFGPSDPNSADQAILVYPDVGDASPVLAWGSGSPGTLERGEDHPMSVVATDADVPAGLLRIEWILGDSWFGTVVATESGYVLPGASLCGTPPQTLPVTVRAIDELGVFAEVGARLDVSEIPPRVAISGAVPSDRLSLPPGGATFAIEGTAWTQCSPSFAWDVSPPWPPGANVSTTGGAGTAVQTIDLPEAAYPGLLAAAAPEVTLTATDGSVPLTASTTLQLQVDATRLVDVAHASDLAAIREGEVAVLETRISSHVGVELPSVHVVHVLAGLVAAGDPEADEADVVETLAGRTEVVLDALPPAGQDVVVRLPVRSAGGRAASAVEVRSSGGHLLTPAAAVPVEASPMPGCGCGSSPAGGALALAALVALRRRARTRPSPG